MRLNLVTGEVTDNAAAAGRHARIRLRKRPTLWIMIPSHMKMQRALLRVSYLVLTSSPMPKTNPLE